jgi:hypothetical protein
MLPEREPDLGLEITSFLDKFSSGKSPRLLLGTNSDYYAWQNEDPIYICTMHSKTRQDEAGPQDHLSSAASNGNSNLKVLHPSGHSIQPHSSEPPSPKPCTSSSAKAEFEAPEPWLALEGGLESMQELELEFSCDNVMEPLEER